MKPRRGRTSAPPLKGESLNQKGDAEKIASIMKEVFMMGVTIHSHSAFHDITIFVAEDEVIVSGGIDQDAAWSAAVEETGGYSDEEAGLERNPSLAEEAYRESIRDILDDVVGALVDADIVAGDLVFRDHDSYCEEIVPLKDRRILRLRAHYYDGNFDFDVEENIDAEEE